MQDKHTQLVINRLIVTAFICLIGVGTYPGATAKAIILGLSTWMVLVKWFNAALDPLYGNPGNMGYLCRSWSDARPELMANHLGV